MMGMSSLSMRMGRGRKVGLAEFLVGIVRKLASAELEKAPCETIDNRGIILPLLAPLQFTPFQLVQMNLSSVHVH